MTNTINLTKIYFKQSFQNLFQKSGKKKSKLSGVLLFTFIAFVLIASSSYTMFSFAKALQIIGQEKFVLVMGLIFAAIINLFMVVYEVQGYFYKTKDYELLASMPINPYSIVIAKYLSSYFTSLLYNSIIALPAFVIYFIFCGVSVGAIIFALISLILLPTFIIFLGSIIGFLINIISSKLKNKNVVTTIISLAFIVAIMLFTSLSGTNELTNIFITGKLPLAIKIIFPYIWFLFEAIITNSFIWFVYFLLITFAYAFLGIVVVALSYKKINSNFMISNVKVSNKPITFNQSSVTKALIKKENKTFWGSAIWSINTLIGPLMMLSISIIFGILINKYFKSGEFSIDDVNTFKAMTISFMAMCSGMSVTTSVSISMEGKKLALLKSFPIEFADIAKAKILFNIIMQIPFIILSAIVFLCFVPFDIIFALLMIFVPIMALLAFSTLGLVINLKWPKLNWTSETEAVKQSLSLLVSMFGDMILAIVPMALYLSFYNPISTVLSLNAVYAIIFAWFAIIFVVAFVLIKKYGKKLYETL